MKDVTALMGKTQARGQGQAGLDTVSDAVSLAQVSNAREEHLICQAASSA